ncbi:MAG: hypothetical protein SWY16_23045 [Cyanobacteriota bacterium]|nr:hypothetical protein [Cyanobacteriota bacterium]
MVKNEIESQHGLNLNAQKSTSQRVVVNYIQANAAPVIASSHRTSHMELCFGVVMTQSSSLTRVSKFIAQVNGEKINAVPQRLKESDREANAKKGQHRRHLDVSQCFAPLLLWVMSWLPSNLKRIALALDATSIAQKFTVLSMKVLLAGCGIPVAWSIVRATEPGSWKPHWLYECIQNVGWHRYS